MKYYFLLLPFIFLSHLLSANKIDFNTSYFDNKKTDSSNICCRKIKNKITLSLGVNPFTKFDNKTSSYFNYLMTIPTTKLEIDYLLQKRSFLSLEYKIGQLKENMVFTSDVQSIFQHNSFSIGYKHSIRKNDPKIQHYMKYSAMLHKSKYYYNGNLAASRELRLIGVLVDYQLFFNLNKRVAIGINSPNLNLLFVRPIKLDDFQFGLWNDALLLNIKVNL